MHMYWVQNFPFFKMGNSIFTGVISENETIIVTNQQFCVKSSLWSYIWKKVFSIFYSHFLVFYGG